MRKVSLHDLTGDELKRINETLHRRFRKFDNDNIIDIAFGQKVSDGKAQHEVFSVCFFVKKKRNPKDLNARIDRLISMRLKRGREFIEIQLPTDVIEMDSLCPTGVGVYEKSTSKFLCTAGLAVRLRRNTLEASFDEFGLVTVAHPFRDSERALKVMLSARLKDNPMIAGTLREHSSLPNSNFDASFVQADKLALDTSGFLQSTGLRLPMSDTQLTEAANSRLKGIVLRTDAQVGIRVTHFSIKTLNPLPFFGHMRGILRGETVHAKLGIGTSGSIWTIDGRVAGLQFASEKPDFKIAYAQSIHAIVNEWLALTFKSQVRILNAF
jgi:hypothetical protein